ncbi:hypothetical protein U9M48_021590 [Paspalum notatum var. saurae]|uniref:Uncharacterized protein n=1 Tax=Paspalum notatum var. saurae TaxID=547442 RepID=A0AAQ3TKY3_PASNO
MRHPAASFLLRLSHPRRRGLADRGRPAAGAASSPFPSIDRDRPTPLLSADRGRPCLPSPPSTAAARASLPLLLRRLRPLAPPALLPLRR